MTGDAATVLWMSADTSRGSVRYRPAEGASEWRPARTIERGGGIGEARLTGLPSDSEISYEVGIGDAFYGPWTFRTAPDVTADPDTVRVLLFGDSGWGSPEQAQLARRMEALDWDLAIHVGDIAYNEGSERDFTERHFKVYRELLAEVPFFPSVGNHDVRANAGASYDLAFDWPAAAPDTRYYTFRWGPVRFVALDTSSPSDDVSGLGEGRGRQFEWLVSTLSAAEREDGVEWTVVFGHHPPYSHAIGISGHGPNRDLRRNLTRLFDEYAVDLVASGHDHHYERTLAIRGGAPVADGCGPVYVIQGAGGASRYARAVGTSPFSAFATRSFSFTELVFVGDRIRGRTLGVDGDVIDTFVLRPYSGPESPGCDP